MLSSLKSRQAYILAGICILLTTFQNCAERPEADSDSKSSYQSGLPFAYRERVDTIAYMSCSEIKDPVERRAYFSYRVGSYNNMTGGLAMTPEFIKATEFYSTQDRARAIASSDVNANAALSLSVRPRNNMQSIWVPGNSMIFGTHIDWFLPPLDGSAVAGPLAGSNGNMLNYFPGSHEKRLMEASLRFYEYENISEETRYGLEGSATPFYLVVGYSNSTDELDPRLRSPSTLPQRAYGTGYGLTFSLPNGFTSGERRVLSPNGAVQEINLATGTQQASNWDCSTNYQFMVIRPEDKAANRVVCNATVDRYANATQQAALNALRRVLRVEDWFIDVDNHCIMPKRTVDYCYGRANIGKTVQYGMANCSDSGTTLCPHFVSVCIRR